MLLTQTWIGNSEILHTRGKILGGCSSVNGCISFRPQEYDVKKWQELGAKGWTFDEFVRLFKSLRIDIHPVYERFQNPIDQKLIQATQAAMGVPRCDNFNDHILTNGNITPSAGFLSIAFDPKTGYRNSAATTYIHPILKGERELSNLTILTNARASRINFNGNTATGATIKLMSGRKIRISARMETVICAGAFDSPRLLLLSGVGPRKQLESLGIPVVKDLPGVGENLMDHAETAILWELKEPVPDTAVSFSDIALFLRREAHNAQGDDGNIMDTMFHVFSFGFDDNMRRHGYTAPPNSYSLLPNLPRPKSRGRIYLTSPDPEVRPAIDYRYFTDVEGHDIQTMLFAIKAGRKIAEASPWKELVKREFAPGPEVQTDEQIIEYVRKTHGTVFHPCGTTKMGDTERDPMAVVDPSLKVRGLRKLRVIDASVFPIIPSINPMITVYCVAQKGAEMIIEDARASLRAKM